VNTKECQRKIVGWKNILASYIIRFNVVFSFQEEIQ